MRVQHDYRDIDDIIRMCRRRIRVPEQWYGDYLATLGAARIGERRLKELCEQYGRDTITSVRREWFDYSERRMAEAIRQLPGRRAASGGPRTIPYPGVPDGVPLKVKVTIDPDEGCIELDLRDNPDSIPGGLNESRACAHATACITGVFNSIDPDVPHNAGSFRRIQRARCARAASPACPAFRTRARWRRRTSPTGSSCLTQAAFAELGEGFGLAEGALGMGISYAVISGHDARLDGAPYVNQIFLGSTGGPGGPLADGWPTYYLPVAASLMYHDSPRSTSRSIRSTSTPSGSSRIRKDLAATAARSGRRSCTAPRNLPMMIAYTFEGHENPARGVRGGLTGAPSDGWKIDAHGNRVDVPMAAAMEIVAGERVLSRTGGGGGYGDPMTRDPHTVYEDVIEGWVSPERARDVYGVVLSGTEPDRLALDMAATEAFRAAASRPVDAA